ncbi:MAG: hypothetical protein ACKPGI_08670, partial [Verrucomicrobiota bacterium]
MTTFAAHPLVTGKRLVVAAAADEAYAMPLAVMLRSAAESLGGAWGLDALEGLKTYLGFQIGTVLTSFLGHRDRVSDSGLTIRPVQLSGTTSPLKIQFPSSCPGQEETGPTLQPN